MVVKLLDDKYKPLDGAKKVLHIRRDPVGSIEVIIEERSADGLRLAFMGVDPRELLTGVADVYASEYS